MGHSPVAAFLPITFKALHDWNAGTERPPTRAIRSLVTHTSAQAMRRMRALFRRLRRRGFERIVAVHIRRGDSEMAHECPRCVAHDEPDVHGAPRIEWESVVHHVHFLNTSRLRPSDGIFVASDTLRATSLLKNVLGAHRIATQRRQVVHNTQHKSVLDSRPMAVDFLGLLFADVLVCIGASSFSGSASALRDKEECR